MIIYKNSIKGFIEDSYRNEILVAKIVANMKEKIGYSVSEKEKNSWKTTLCNTSRLFAKLNPIEEQYILLEFKVPKSKKRIDIILVGKNGNTKNLMIIELKGWSQVQLDNNSNLLKINTSYRESIHPAFEAYDYKKILDDRFSDLKKEFKISTSAFLPNFIPGIDNPLENTKYNEIINLVKTYTKTTENNFVEYLKKLFNTAIDFTELQKINKLEYKPSKSFLDHISNQFESIELIDSQRLAFEKITKVLTLFQKTQKKTLITVSGSAGSGKTVIAFKILGFILKMGLDIKLMMPGPEFRQAVQKKFGDNTISEFIGGADINSRYNYLIIDEAHKATGNGTSKAFYEIIIKKTNFIIALIDDMQVINKKGITRDELEDIAIKNNFAVSHLNLQEYFRNGGDSTYIEWLKNWIKNEDNGQEEFVQNFFSFDILNEKEFNDKYMDFYEKFNVRLLSFWTQNWNIEKLENDLPIKNIKIGNSFYAWNPNWQWLTKLKKNNPNIKITKNLNDLCNIKNFNSDKKGYEYIGYFNTTQGSEFDYIFVHIPKLFFWNEIDKKIDVDLSLLINSEMHSQIWSVKNIKNVEEKFKKIELNKKYFLNRLFVNLTRGTKGVFIFCEDKKLELFLKNRIRKSKNN
ncbi:MAG: DNA/RNA helicase domain-containing protein [Metamycoplasmataceae bacterium]